MNNYKELIPELLSILTPLKRINGFSFCRNISLYNNSNNANLINVKINKINNLKFPENLEKKYNFRDGYYINYKNIWYYYKKLKLGLSLKFIYEEKGNSLFFNYNQLYSYVPFEIGHIYPAGRHLADIITFKLFMLGYYCFTGCAVREKNGTTAWISPSYNGKTTLVKNKIKNDAKYITEDVVIVDKNLENIYPLNNFNVDRSRRQSKILFEILKNKKNVLSGKQKLDNLIFYVNTFSGINLKFDPESFLITNSLFFLRNRFIRAIILKNNLGNEVVNNIKKFNLTLNTNNKVHFDIIKSFNFH